MRRAFLYTVIALLVYMSPLLIMNLHPGYRPGMFADPINDMWCGAYRDFLEFVNNQLEALR